MESVDPAFPGEGRVDPALAPEGQVDANFRQRVEALVAQIPQGRVMTYGQLAALCGNARAARIVGGIAHFGDPKLPWQRVVNKSGGLAAGYPGGRQGHAEHLRAEGVTVVDEHVDVHALLWWPEGASRQQTVDSRLGRDRGGNGNQGSLF